MGIDLIRSLLQKDLYEIASLDIALFDYPENESIQTIRGGFRDPETVANAMNEARKQLSDAGPYGWACSPSCTNGPGMGGASP